MGAPWAFLGCWCLRRRSREELLLGIHGSWSFPICTETSELYGLTWVWAALLLPFLNGVGGHQTALLHIFLSTIGDILFLPHLSIAVFSTNHYLFSLSIVDRVHMACFRHLWYFHWDFSSASQENLLLAFLFDLIFLTISKQRI